MLQSVISSSHWHSDLLHFSDSLFSYLRVVPAGHNQPLPPRPSAPPSDDIYAPLIHNPYIPFWHIWKPMTLWSKRNWDKGSEEGLKTQRPDYFAAVIQYVCMVCLMIWRLPLTHIFASERGLRLCLLFTNLKKFTLCCPMNPKALSSDMVPNTSGLLAPRCQNPKHRPPLRFLLVYNLS